MLPLTLLVGVGCERLLQTRWSRAIIAVTVAATLACGVFLGRGFYQQILARRDVYRVVKAAGLKHAIVLLKTASSDMPRPDLNRNPPDFRNAPVMYAMSRPNLDYEIAAANPGRALYYYEYRAEGGRIWLALPNELRGGASGQ